jgi:hypothetical protein
LEKGHKQYRTIVKDTILWRAQLGNDLHTVNAGKFKVQQPTPFSEKRMKPPKGRAKEGRANPKGIPYLYASDTKETAMAEVRPGLSMLISVAQLKTLQDLRIIDFVSENNFTLLEYYLKNDPANIDKYIWSSIGESFSKPVNPSDDLAEYIPTQIITELFKNDGFDGLAYQSSFGKGQNLLFYDINSVEITDCTLFEVKKISHEFKKAIIL